MRGAHAYGTGFSNRHFCTLPREEDDEGIPRAAPFAPRIVKLFYSLRALGTISSNSARCRQYFRSRASIRKEKIRHMTQFKYTIHPLSVISEAEQVFMIFLWMALFIVLPLMSCFMPEELLGDKPIMVTLNLLALAHIFVSFFLGYIVQQTGEVVLSLKKIAKNYLLTYFLWDFIPTFVSLFLYQNTFLSTPLKYFVFQISMLRFCRLRTMTQYIDWVLQLMDVRDSFRTCFILFLMSFLIVHWWTCLLNFLEVLGNVMNYKPLQSMTGKELIVQEDYLSTTDGLRRYFQLANLAICHFYGVFIHTHTMLNDYQMLLLSFILIAGLTFYLYSATVMLQLFGMVNFSETKYEEMLSAVTEYMRLKNFPEDLQKHIALYYDYKFEKKYFMESALLNSLSEHLRLEVLLYSCYHMIDRVEVLKGLPKPAIGCILALLQQDLFLPGEVVTSDEDISETLYFILYGTCGMYITSTNPVKEIHHMEDGSHFGDTVQMMGFFHASFRYQIIALEACETYYLDKNSVKFCVENYPEIGDKLEDLRYKGARMLVDYLNSSMVQINDGAILTDLRHGRILEGMTKHFDNFFA